MQELRREYDIMTMQMRTITIIVIDIMLCIRMSENSPGMYQRPTLDIQPVEQRVQIKIKSSLIPIVPDHNRRMVHILFDHLLHQL